jgi:hypothetical protein
MHVVSIACLGGLPAHFASEDVPGVPTESRGGDVAGVVEALVELILRQGL